MKRALRAAVVAVAASLAASPAAAHVGSLSGSVRAGDVPTWLVIVTGGGVIGASFLFASFMTDHDAIRAVNARGLSLPAPAGPWRWARRAGMALGVVGLVAVLVTGLVGPRSATANLAILVVWAGWWAGYTMSVYLVGNTWPAINPWKAIAGALPRIGDRDLPEELGAWPSAVGLLGLVWIEVVSPIANEPRLLVAVIVVYSIGTLAGAAVYGREAWFGAVDPVARVFRCYGRIAPVQRTESGIELKLPGAAVVERPDLGERDETPFVIALLWATTYDGLVSTPAWETLARAVVGAGVPALLVYLVAMAVGFGAFLRVYRAASRYVRETAGTYVTAAFIERWFVASLLPIAAGYHLAHFLGYFLTLLPALLTVLANPLGTTGAIRVLVLPGWFTTLQLAFVLVGHVVAVWTAHAIAFDLFPGRLSPIRSQYPFVAVMIGYTMTSTWIIAQPFTPPPYV